MKLLTQSGTAIIKFSNPGAQSGEVLSVGDVISPFMVGLDDWKIGVVFALRDIRLEVKVVNSIGEGEIPVINIEDSIAKKMSASIAAKKNSPRIGLEFLVDNKSLGIIDLKNYNIIYNLSVLSRFGESKFLNKNSVLSAAIVNLGSGSLTLNDYINIQVDYIFELNGFKAVDDLLLKFE